MTRDDPPDWALPAWDAIDPGTTVPGGTFGLRVLGVSDVTRAVRDALRGDPRLADVWVEGEVGRVTISSAGHAYFTLKDERSQLACVWFRDDRLASPFEARTGLRVVVHGRIDVFDAQGVYQCYVAAVQPAGLGDLALRFEATKARLAAEGLFDAAAQAPAAAAPGDRGRGHEPLRRGAAGRAARPRAALADDAAPRERLPGAGGRGGGDDRRRARPPGALRRGLPRRRPPRRRGRPS